MDSLQVEFTGQNNELALNLLTCKSVRTKGKIRLCKGGKIPNVLNHLHRGANGCANLAFTTFAHIFLLLCTRLHMSKFEGKSIFSSSDSSTQ